MRIHSTSVPVAVLAVIVSLTLGSNGLTVSQAPEPALLTVNAIQSLGLFSPFTDLSQGGIPEVTDPNFWISAAPIFNYLETSWVRIDHIFDDSYYHIIQYKPDGTYGYDWTNLDIVLTEILKTRAKPFFCLSYMPIAFSRDNTPYQAPTTMDNWKALSSELVRHMKTRFNLTGLYYEVWNEPDSFHFWKASQDDYFSLYQATVESIKSTDISANVGGPALSTVEWLAPFLNFVRNQNLQLDFLSWHIYTYTPATYSQQIHDARQLLSSLTFPSSVEIIVTEWNISGSLNASHDAYYNAGHTAAVLSALHDEKVSKAFFFAPKDYLASQLLYGGWGLVTYNDIPKPAYNCFDVYHRLKDGQRLAMSFTDTSIKGFAVINGTALKVLFWNYSDKQPFGEPRIVRVVLNLSGTPFSKGTLNKKEYLIDSQHSNITANIQAPYLQLVNSIEFVDKEIIEETVSLENGGVVYLEFNIEPPPPTNFRTVKTGE